MPRIKMTSDGKDGLVGLASLSARAPYADRNQILKSFFCWDRSTVITISSRC